MRAARSPLYHRLLRLRHLEPSPMATFVLFEGSVMSAILLSLAEIVDWWSVLFLPVTVAVMVKLNDIIAGVLRRPDAIAQLSRAPLTGGVAVGRSVRQAPPPRRPAGGGVARGIAAVPPRDDYRPDGS